MQLFHPPRLLPADYGEALRHGAAHRDGGAERLRRARHRPASEAVALVALVALTDRAGTAHRTRRVGAASEEAAVRSGARGAEHGLCSVVVLQDLRQRHLPLEPILVGILQRHLNRLPVRAAISGQLEGRCKPVVLVPVPALRLRIGIVREDLEPVKQSGHIVDIAAGTPLHDRLHGLGDGRHGGSAKLRSQRPRIDPAEP
mmetsp:Transcript_30217/g.87071  ORF Transcript_30217/g.87071 Transcript_30217/m.87071 type:complete len:201 (-) Transcript_30217:141-743(-)